MAGILRRMVRKTHNAIGDAASATGNAIGSAWGELSGAHAQRDAAKQMLQGGQQAMDSLQAGNLAAQNYAKELYNPGDIQTLRSNVLSGAYTPAYQMYKGPMDAGNQFNPGFMAYQGQMTSPNANPTYQGYTGPARPERQDATTANLDLYSDPGYQFRLNEGLRALQGSAAGKGMLNSSASQRGIMDYAQGLASQEFQNRYNRFNTDQNNRMGDFESDRGFGYNDINNRNSFAQTNASRTQGAFEGDRAAGLSQNNFLNNFNMGNADRGLQAFNGDRTFAYNANNDINSWNAGQADKSYARLSDVAGISTDANRRMGDYAYQGGRDVADLQTGMANTRAAGTLGQSAANRGMVKDIFNGGVRLASMIRGGR